MAGELMADLWYPPAHRDVLADGGRFVVGGEPWCGVLHTTEGKTYMSARSAYVTNKSAPHFTVTFEDGRFVCYQHAALNRAARSLKNDPGGVETNRRRCVQIEIVCTCDPSKAGKPGWLYAADLPTVYLDGIAILMRWLEANLGIHRVAAKLRSYPASYGARSGVRFTSDAWRKFNGWCGHQNVPENLHGDPGGIDIAYLLNNTPPPAPGTRLVYHSEVDHMQLHDVEVPVSDGNGHGHTLTNLPHDRLASVVGVRDTDADDEGTYTKGHFVKAFARNTGGKVDVYVEDGPDGFVIPVRVAIAD